MGIMLSEQELARTEVAERAGFDSPIPTRIVSNGEYSPPGQTAAQREVEARLTHLADETAPRLGLDRRRFLRTAAGMAAAFVAMNQVHGPLFEVSTAEAQQPDRAAARASALSGQFIFDDQTHFVRDDF